jgi:hypothetical protein
LFDHFFKKPVSVYGRSHIKFLIYWSGDTGGNFILVN